MCHISALAAAYPAFFFNAMVRQQGPDRRNTHRGASPAKPLRRLLVRRSRMLHPVYENRYRLGIGRYLAHPPAHGFLSQLFLPSSPLRLS